MKPNDTHQYLLSSSCHPYHTKRSIPYSLGLRLSRICSDDTAFNKRCNELAEHLKKRGYKEKLILLEINKAKQVPRDQALKPSVPKNKCNQGIPFVVTYNPASPNLNTIISKHFPNKVGKKVLKKIMSSYLKTGLKNNNFKQVSSGIKKKTCIFLVCSRRSDCGARAKNKTRAKNERKSGKKKRGETRFFSRSFARFSLALHYLNLTRRKWV